MELVKLSKKGQLSIPRSILRQLKIEGEIPLLVDVSPDGVIQLRQAVVFPVELYTPERLQEFEKENRLSSEETTKVEQLLKKKKRQ